MISVFDIYKGIPIGTIIKTKKLGHHKTLMYGRVGYIVGVVVEGIAASAASHRSIW